jgi:hypothetical protein
VSQYINDNTDDENEAFLSAYASGGEGGRGSPLRLRAQSQRPHPGWTASLGSVNGPGFVSDFGSDQIDAQSSCVEPPFSS